MHNHAIMLVNVCPDSWRTSRQTVRLVPNIFWGFRADKTFAALLCICGLRTIACMTVAVPSGLVTGQIKSLGRVGVVVLWVS